MKNSMLAILTALVMLLAGCTLTIKKEQGPNDNLDNDLSGEVTDMSDNSNEDTSDDTAGSPADGKDFIGAVEDMDNIKIECADSFITDVYSSLTYDVEKNFKEAKYIIIQGKDGTKYSAELRYDSKEYTYYFTVKNEGGEDLLSLTTYASYYGDVFKILDLNMDGYADIQFITAEGTMNSVYDFYLWDNAARNYVKAECDEELLFVDLKADKDYLQLWGRNSGGSGVIERYKWEGNKLVKISEEEYHADDAASGDADAWCFTRDDIKIDGKDILDITYEQLLRTFGNPAKTKTFKINPPATEPDHFEYIYVCVYDGFECEFYTGEIEKTPEPADIVFKFDITGAAAQLDCELFIGIDKDELDLRYGISKIYKLDDAESYDLNNIKSVLKGYKPDGYYSEYEKAAIVYHDVNSFEEPLAKALVLLFDDDGGYDTDRVDRIVFGYPTAG